MRSILALLLSTVAYGQLSQSGGNFVVTNTAPVPSAAYAFYKPSTATEAAGVVTSLLTVTGKPGAAVLPTPGINGQAVTALAGQIPYSNAAVGKSKYLSYLGVTGATLGYFGVYDLMWINSGLVVTTTTAQAITPAAAPARDNNGSTNGEGVEAWILVRTATTNVAAITNMTISYTNSAGTAGRTGTISSYPATAVVNTMVPFNLQAGDIGVRSIQSVTLGTSLVGGAVSMVLVRPLSGCGGLTAFFTCQQDLRYSLVKMYDDSVPFLVSIPSATATGAVFGQINMIEQ